MGPLIARGHVWRVVRVSPDDSLLVDRTGTHTIATADPTSKVIRISTSVPLSMLDRVLMHEAAHAMMEEAGVNDLLSRLPDERQQVLAEELLAWFLETHAIEVIDAVSSSLGRPVCVAGTCIGGSQWR
jgi:hypothetical protein